MSFGPKYEWVDQTQLAEMLRANKQNHVAVVDVRDDDFEGGNIKGCVNVPSQTFQERLDKGDILQQLRPYNTVVFHCHLSQQRGPKAAGMYAEAVQARAGETATATSSSSSSNPSSSQQRVLVLRDGFAGFGPKYKDDASLVENWDQESWQYR